MDKDRTANVRYQALLQLLRTADSIWNASHAFFDRWELGPSQFNVLNLLYSQPEGLSQIELSRQLIMHRSNVTGLVDRLEKRGLLVRKDLASDRRAYRVVLTESGTSLLDEILPAYYRGAEGLWEGISTRGLNELISHLSKAAKNAEQLTAGISGERKRSREGKEP
jgi:DNA-binding MarR family transcriptional regulator